MCLLNNEEWSKAVAELVADALFRASLLEEDKISKAIEIISEEISVRLIIGDYPLPNILRNWSFNTDEISSGVFLVIGLNKDGNKVSREGIDPDILMAQVFVDALKIEKQSKT